MFEYSNLIFFQDYWFIFNHAILILSILIRYQKNNILCFLDARNFFLKRSFCTEVCHCEQTSCAQSVLSRYTLT